MKIDRILDEAKTEPIRPGGKGKKFTVYFYADEFKEFQQVCAGKTNAVLRALMREFVRRMKAKKR